MNVSKKEKYSFGVGAFGKDVVICFVGIFFAYYLTDVLYLSPVFIGILFFLARIWDAINDPIMGIIIDNTQTKHGKFRLWLAIGTLTNALVFILLFSTFGLTGLNLCIYISIMYVLFDITYTMMDVPYWAWLPNLTDNPQERESVSVVPRIFGSLAALVIASLGLQIVDFFGKGSQLHGFQLSSIIISLIFVILIAITIFNVPEKRMVASKKGEKIGLKKIMMIIKENDQLKAFIGFFLSFNIGIQILNSFTIYYFIYAIGNEYFFSIFTLTILFEMLGMSLFPKTSQKIGRSKTYWLACALVVLGLLFLFITGILWSTSISLVIISGMIQKIGSGLSVGISTVALADCIDYGEMKFGERYESVVASTQTFSVKLAMAFSGLLIGAGLNFLGYIPNEVQLPNTILGIRVLTCLVPIIFILISLLIYNKYYQLKDRVKIK
ncbi:melibiose/sodium symporter [Bacillus anthracis]|uniref:Melibiose/sodium symporter n=1 Tax=Bacillus anthracis TaxID=1392 RepID=A0A640MMR1_BACAN|nr:melibiose:sodium transporter MelB [Enterococcus faecalis]GEU13538.1 melibiose/sodium symporter [Bacillus anthracis]